MCFRKDELIVPEESEDDEENEDPLCEIFNTEDKSNSKPCKTIADTHELTEEIEGKIDKVHLTLR